MPKETAYKGKNIRVTNEAHQAAIDHCGKKIVVGAWVSEAIEEKLQREVVCLMGDSKWPIKKETK